MGTVVPDNPRWSKYLNYGVNSRGPGGLRMVEQQDAGLRLELAELRAQQQEDRKAIELLQRRVEDLEDLLDAQASRKEAQRDGTIPWEDVKRDLGL